MEIKDLSFSLGEIEPLFGIVALYDLKKKMKVSENFHFDVNSQPIIDLLSPNHKVSRSSPASCQITLT